MDMPDDEFLRCARRIDDWIVAYQAHPDRYPVLSQVAPGEIRALLSPAPPSTPEQMTAILDDFERIVVPGLTHWNQPGFMAYFDSCAPRAGILAEALSAALNQNAMLWRTSPAATEVEEVAVDWLRQLLGLPDAMRGMITDTASISSMLAIAAAREAVPGLCVREEGLSGRPDVPRLRLYASEQAHSSIEKAAMTLGIGRKGLQKIPTDEQFRMIPAELDRAMLDDTGKGWRPFCVVSTAGTTSTTAIDPTEAIARICERHRVWLHVDAAYGGSAAAAEQTRFVLDGCDRADSVVVNPHKWLFVPLDCSVLFVRDPGALRRAFSLVPDYLASDGDVTNYMDWGVQLGRRFRGLKLWFTLRWFGRDRLAAMITEHVRIAHEFAGWIDAAPDFERLAPAPLSVVCFRAHPRGVEAEPELDRLNARLVELVNRTGEVFLSHTRLRGRFTIRLAIGHLRTAEAHVRRAWELLQDNLRDAGGE